MQLLIERVYKNSALGNFSEVQWLIVIIIMSDFLPNSIV